jgi:hypothetical protein
LVDRHGEKSQRDVSGSAVVVGTQRKLWVEEPWHSTPVGFVVLRARVARAVT